MGGFDATMWQRVRAGSTARGAGLACWWRGPSGAFGGAAFAGAALRRGESQPVGNAVGGKAGRCTVGKRQEPPRDRPTDGARAESPQGSRLPAMSVVGAALRCPTLRRQRRRRGRDRNGKGRGETGGPKWLRLVSACRYAGQPGGCPAAPTSSPEPQEAKGIGQEVSWRH